MSTNKNTVSHSDVLASSISNHHLVHLVLTLKTPRLNPSYVTIRSYTGYNVEWFCEDLAIVPFHVISIFDDYDDHVDTFNALFTDIMDAHAPIKRGKIKARPNLFVTTEIHQLIKTWDQWHQSAIKSNDHLHWNAYRFFRQEVKHELRFAQKAHVRSKLMKSSGNSNGIWKIINNCLPRKKHPHPNVPGNPCCFGK